MNAGRGRRRKKEPVPPPGDDVVPVPPPVHEEPPHDNFCDLVLTGGVASGVVYPWAIVELARAFRFRNIGGTSVGAMAAALAAAAEYGRSTGYEAPFEALRRAPASLAWIMSDGRTRMLSLFQPNEHGRRLIRLWGEVGRGNEPRKEDKDLRCPARGVMLRAFWLALCIYKWPVVFGAVAGAVLAKVVACWTGLPPGSWTGLSIVFVAVVAVLAAVLSWAWAIWHDIRYGLIKNSYGLCKGGTIKHPGRDDGPGISEWLHDGIQASAGLGDDDPPLTFRDLWSAPAYPGAGRRPCGAGDPADRRSINLQVITTNVMHGRPYRLPLADKTSRLFFLRDELEDYFPPCVLDALVAASRPYAPRDSKSDPPVDRARPGLLELPEADLPVVVAARLSLSFPLLFSAVPLWAIDYEAPRHKRTLRRCLFTDGGVSSNFPIHLFDAAVPRWPTFGLWLDRRSPYRRQDRDEPGAEERVWLPKFNGEGWGDSWYRFDPESKVLPEDGGFKCDEPALDSSESHLKLLLGFLGGIATSAMDWRDRTSFRMPHVRNRVARILLLPGEGGLHIGMPREQILQMAHDYGTKAGQKFVERFAERDGQPSRAWSEQRWIRFNLLVNGLRERLEGLATRAGWSTHTVPLPRAIALAVRKPGGPVADRGKCHRIKPAQAASLNKLLLELERLEGELLAAPPAFDSTPEPELRLRPPL